MNIVTVTASAVVEGDVLTDAEGRYSRTVVEVDRMSSAHGKIILRTGRKGTGSTVVDPNTMLHVARQ